MSSSAVYVTEIGPNRIWKFVVIGQCVCVRVLLAEVNPASSLHCSQGNALNFTR